jgi:D-alanyl-D-alanine dipeptidase
MKTIKDLKELKNVPIEERKELYIPEDITQQITRYDNGEELVDLEKLFKSKEQPFYFEYELPELKETGYPIRKAVAEKLLKIQQGLGTTYHLKFFCALRPISLQRKLFTAIQADIVKENPNLKGKELWLKTTEFVADPAGEPPHSTGGVVDLTLVGKNGEELDMGGPYNGIEEKSNTFYSDLTNEQKENRMKLFNAMIREGFVNLPTEWWHYSYGDQYWAAFNSQSKTIYAKVENPPV